MGGASAWSYFTDYLPWEVGSSVGESHMMAAAEAYGMWQRIAAKGHRVLEDAIRSPRVVNCPLPRYVSRSQADSCQPIGYSHYWSNGCFSPESKLDLQFSANTYRDYHSEVDEGLNGRFSKPAGLQSLVVESPSVKKSVLGLSVTSDYNTAQLEFQWQFVIDPHPESGLTAPTSEHCKEDEDVTFEGDNKLNCSEILQQEHPSEFLISETYSKSTYDAGPHGSRYGAFLGRQKLLSSNCGAVCREFSEDQDKSSGSSIQSVLWQVADKDISAGNVTQNCNLSSRQARLITNGATSFNSSPSVQNQPDMSQIFRKSIVSSLSCGSEFKLLDVVVASSPGSGSVPTIPEEHWHRLSEPQTMPSISGLSRRHGSHSFRDSQFSGGAVTVDQGSGLFAEALCHSQTRAREAEKKVQRAFEEKERLMRMFFKEAYLAFTYRQWVTSLQSENMWLRMSPRHQPVTWLQYYGVFNPFSALERLSGKHWMGFGKDYLSQYHMNQNLPGLWHGKALVCLGDPSDTMMKYTLAFALGLSLAGAGLVLGWSMGWILLAY